MAFLSGSALADTKIGTVDLRKLFDNYWKTKTAQTAIQERASQLDKDDKGMKEDLKKGSDEYQKLLSQVNDQGISTEERERRKQAADEGPCSGFFQVDMAGVLAFKEIGHRIVGIGSVEAQQNVIVAIEDGDVGGHFYRCQ